jgi:ribonuclease HI
MVVYERKGNVPSLTLGASSSSPPPFRNPNENNFQPKAIMPRSCCNFCKEQHEESTCEVKKSARDKIFGRRPETTIVVLDFAEPEDVMIINTRNKSYAPKIKYDPPHTSSSPSSSSPAAIVQVLKVLDSQGTTSPLPSSKSNILNQLTNFKADATLLDMVVIPKKHKHLKNFMEGKDFVVANLSEEIDEEDSSVNKVGVNNFRHLVKKTPFYISVKIMDKIAICCLIDDDSVPSVMSKIIMEELSLSCTNENTRSMLSYNSLQQTTICEIKDVTLVFFAHSEIRTTLNIQVINMPVSNYSIILGRDWQSLMGGYLSLDGTHLSVPRNGKNIIVLREGRISPYIESVPQRNVNYVEEDLGVYSIFANEGNITLEQINLDDGMWHMHFDGSCSNEGNKVGIILYSPVGKIHNFPYKLEFACTNNVTEFEALLLGIQNAYNMGCGHLTVFWDSKLVVNLVCKIYSPSNKLMKHYTQTVWEIISNLLSFNITHVKRELNSMDDRLVVFPASPNRQLFPQRPDYAFEYLYRPHIPDNIESWQVFPSDESIFSFIQNEPYKPKEIISMEDNKIPKGLTRLESSFSSSDVGNKEKHKEEESKRKVGETISLKIGTPESPKNVKIGAQCFVEEKLKFARMRDEFQDVFAWYYEDLRGFDIALIEHSIPIKEGIKPVRKKQRPINPALEDTIRKELEKILKAEIIFLVKYSEWISNLVPVQKITGQIILCVDFRALNRPSIKDHFSFPNMEMILQQVARSQMMSLLDGFSSYNQIKVKREDKYKTTFITHWGTFPYECMSFGFSNAGATF